MLIDFAELSPNRIYFSLIQTIIPRPIAWVLSKNEDGGLNLAPFSYFNAVCSDPPLVMLSVGKKSDGAPKDTRENILQREAFVVHIPHVAQAAQVNATSRELPSSVSELAELGLETEPFGAFELPRLRACRAALACRRFQVIELGSLPQALILGRVEAIYLDDDIAAVDASGRLRIDAARLDPLSRLGGDDFSGLGEIFSIQRPR